MLLRFLEDGSFTRVGETTPRRSDIRLVCATCRDLPKLVSEGLCRESESAVLNAASSASTS
jgi:transcriptional regulator of aromatic amino acid metabolism